MMFLTVQRQRIYMKNQALFSTKDKSKTLNYRLLQFLFGALRVTGNISKLMMFLIEQRQRIYMKNQALFFYQR